jgi:hypothetical protein
MNKANDSKVGETRPYHGRGGRAHKPAAGAIEICNRCGNVLTSKLEKSSHSCVQLSERKPPSHASFPSKTSTQSKENASSKGEPSTLSVHARVNGWNKQTPAKFSFDAKRTAFSVLVLVLSVSAIIAAVANFSNERKSFLPGNEQTTEQPVKTSSSSSTFGADGAVEASKYFSPESCKGRWELLVESGTERFPGVMQILPQGNTLIGNGKDDLGSFQIRGQFAEPDKILFTKQYDAESCKRGAHPLPIQFAGTLRRKMASALQCDGRYQTQVKIGFAHSYYRKSQWRPVQQSWSARKISDSVDATIASAQPDFKPWNPLKALDAQPVPQTARTARNAGASQDSGLNGAFSFFLTSALAVIASGIGIAFIANKLFGVDGISSRSEVSRYIPKQFKGEHNKMLSQFGKPVETGGVPIGTRADWHWWSFWKPKQLSIPADVRERNPHTLIIGTSGKGKTRLVASMVAHDIECADRALVIIDSSGELTDLVSARMKRDKNSFDKRVVLVNPSKNYSSPAYNPLELAPDGDLQAAASAIVHSFKAIYTESPGNPSKWNQQTANILRNAALLLIRNQRTLADLPALLQDNDFRDLMLETIELKNDKRAEDITLIETWNQYKRLARSEQWIEWVEPLLNQVGPMLSDSRIRSIVSKPMSDLSLKQIILEKKILIVRVSKSELGQNANLLGSLIITGLQQAALELNKNKKSPTDRKVALYLDEMDTFVDKETITNLCAETARYQIGFVALLKTLQHIPEDFRHKLLISVGTIAAFSLARKDGELLGPQMFRVDGRKFRHQTIDYFTNRMVIPQPDKAYHLISDEEKLNIDRVVAQDSQHFFCYFVGTTAGVFKMRAHNFELQKGK